MRPAHERRRQRPARRRHHDRLDFRAQYLRTTTATASTRTARNWASGGTTSSTGVAGKSLHFTGANGAINSRNNTVIGNTFIGSLTGWIPLTQIKNDGLPNAMTRLQDFQQHPLQLSGQRHTAASMCLSSTTLSGPSVRLQRHDRAISASTITPGSTPSPTGRARGTSTRTPRSVHKTDDVNVWVEPLQASRLSPQGRLRWPSTRARSRRPSAQRTRPASRGRRASRFDAGCYEYAERRCGARHRARRPFPTRRSPLAYSQTLVAGRRRSALHVVASRPARFPRDCRSTPPRA